MPIDRTVAVIVPVFNSRSYLADLERSLDAQGDVISTIIAIDDGSTDDSFEYLQDWSERNDKMVVLHQENRGQSSARNVGIGYLSSQNEIADYILFMDSDDMLETDSLPALVELANAENLDMVEFSGTFFFESDSLRKRFAHFDGACDKKGRYASASSGMDYFAQCVSAHEFMSSPCRRLLSSSLVLSNGIRFYEGIIHEDNLFTIQCFLHAHRVSYCPERFYLRRVREGSTMTTPLSWKNVHGYFRCVLELLKEIDAHPELSETQLNAIKVQIDSFISSIRNNPVVQNQEEIPGNLACYSSSEKFLFEWSILRRNEVEKQIDALNSRISELNSKHDIVEYRSNADEPNASVLRRLLRLIRQG